MVYSSKKVKSEYDQAYQKKIRIRNRQRLDDLKRVPCAICGVQYQPWQMQFDHIDHTQKKFNISKAARMYDKWETILAEISKCRVLCANCHADVTHRDHKLYFDRTIKVIEPEPQMDLL